MSLACESFVLDNFILTIVFIFYLLIISSISIGDIIWFFSDDSLLIHNNKSLIIDMEFLEME